MFKGELRAVSSLTEQDKERMFRIMTRHYAAVDRSEFQRDMSEKDGAIVLLDEAGRIQGFSTYLFIQIFQI